MASLNLLSNKHTLTGVAAAALALALPMHAAMAQTVVKLGFSSPLSGAQSPNGQDNLDGLKLAVAELNAKPISVKGQAIKFEVMAEDDAADPRQGVAVAQKLVDSKVQFVIGPYNSGVTLPASKVYNDAGALVLTVASNPSVTAQGYNGVFRVGASDNQLGSKMAAYAAKELKVKRVVIVDDRSAYGQGVAEEFAREAKAQKIEIVAREFTNDKANDFSAILTSARAAKPDAVFLGGYTPQAGPMLRQMQSLGLKAKLLGGDGVCSSETAKLAGSNAAAENNVWCTQGGAMLDRASKGQAFITKYKTTYKRDPLTYAVAFYDAAFVLANAMNKAQSLEPAKVGAAMAAGSHAGVAGTYAFDAKHDLKSSPVTVFTFKDGQPSPVTTY